MTISDPTARGSMLDQKLSGCGMNSAFGFASASTGSEGRRCGRGPDAAGAMPWVGWNPDSSQKRRKVQSVSMPR